MYNRTNSTPLMIPLSINCPYDITDMSTYRTIYWKVSYLTTENLAADGMSATKYLKL